MPLRLDELAPELVHQIFHFPTMKLATVFHCPETATIFFHTNVKECIGRIQRCGLVHTRGNVGVCSITCDSVNPNATMLAVEQILFEQGYRSVVVDKGNIWADGIATAQRVSKSLQECVSQSR